MFRQNAVFVVGAGASTEYGHRAEVPFFPVGAGLRAKIKSGCNYEADRELERTSSGDPIVYEWLKKRYGFGRPEFSARMTALRRIAKRIEAFDSIDECIEYLDDPHVSEMGKVMIARFLAEAEGKSLLKTRQNRAGELSMSALSGTWLETFARILMNGRRDPNDIGKELTIICFNYDRCIEFYLINAIRERYDVSYDHAHRIVSNMAIIHPYGTLGKLPENHFALPHEIPFAPDLDGQTDPWDTIIGLKTYTERVEDHLTMRRMKEALFNSELVVFLGFGFTTENMKLLNTADIGENGSGSRSTRISTGKGQHPESNDALRWKIAQLFPGSWHIGSLNIEVGYGYGCADIMTKHYHRISA